MISKGKILGVRNTPDSLWFTFAPEDKTLNLLEGIFDLYDLLYDDKSHDVLRYYSSYTKGGISILLRKLRR